jgi:hypothetical protein
MPGWVILLLASQAKYLGILVLDKEIVMAESNVDLRNRTDMEQVRFTPHPPIPSKEVDMKHYHSAQAYMRFITKDGKVIEFKHHFLATNNSSHQEYLDEEIQKHGNLALSYADPVEVGAWKMRVDPKGTVAEELKSDPDFMGQLRWEMENKVRREQGLQELPPLGGTDNSLEKIQGVDGEKKENVIITPTAKVTLESMQDKAKAMQGQPPKLTPAGTDKLPEGASGDSNSLGTPAG